VPVKVKQINENFFSYTTHITSSALQKLSAFFTVRYDLSGLLAERVSFSVAVKNSLSNSRIDCCFGGD
jgi:hypothetical protein